MILNILNPAGEAVGKKKLPAQFDVAVNEDLIQRAVLTLRANARQQYGATPTAGKRSSAVLSRRRRDYRGSYGIGISRVPRKIMSHRGTRFNWVGAFAPGTVGGRRAHPPKGYKNWDQKINKKENRKAICSALAATVHKQIVAARGHKVPENYPFILAKEFEELKKTKEVITGLEKLGLTAEMQRGTEKSVRAGKGKLRNRKYKQKKSLLLLVSKECPLSKSARNLPGFDVSLAKNVNAHLLAPGGHPGRITLLTEQAVDEMAAQKMFLE